MSDGTSQWTQKRPAPQSQFSLKRALLIGLAAFIVWQGGLWFYDRFIRSDEDKIRLLFQSAVEGANERSPRRVTAILHKEFAGPEGCTFDLAHNFCILILVQQFRVVDISLKPQPLNVLIDPSDPKKATVAFQVHAKGKTTETAEWEEIEGRYSESTNTTLKATLLKTNDGWRVTTIGLTRQ
ncbi:MAG TPA: hypothetical protein VGP72_24075 [Planctomycetota bacterium]|jgi:hypothetical protein